jgi:predicted nucleic acid-binding protein
VARVKALFDTCILVDYLRGDPRAAEEISRFERRAVSVVTWMELMVGARDPAEEPKLRAFLDGFEPVELTREVAEEAVRLRRARRIQLPDAIIWASAKIHGALLVTRNTRDFPPDHHEVRVPYTC